MTSLFPVPLNALRAIEIVARTHALGPAAAELGVTPGAVSQHIRRAEERLGLKLFERQPEGLIPTPDLENVRPQLRAGFAALADAVTGLTAGHDEVLTLTTASVFASRWMVWRVAKFTALYPEIDLRLAVTGKMLDLDRPDIDCAIRFGRGEWPGVDAFPIGGFSYQPVCAPPVADRLASPRDIADVPVIRDQSSMLPWAPWWRLAGIADPPETHGPVYSEPALAFDAAISEQGVLMAVDMMSADSVSDGRLVRPFDLPLQSEVGYWLAVPAGKAMPRKLKLLRDWLTREVPDSVKGYVHQMPGRPRLVTRPNTG